MYNGQIRELRKALLHKGLVSVDEVATMTDDAVISKIKNHYILCVEYDEKEYCETLFLLPKELYK